MFSWSGARFLSVSLSTPVRLPSLITLMRWLPSQRTLFWTPNLDMPSSSDSLTYSIQFQMHSSMAVQYVYLIIHDSMITVNEECIMQ